MNKLIGYGYPFDYRHSSCSNRTPKTFSWDVPKVNEPIDKLVLIDNAIMEYEKIPSDIPLLYGWVCESRSIVPELSNFIAVNHSKLKKRFKQIFVSDKQLIQFGYEYCPAGSNLPWIAESKYAIYPKTKLASMVASAKTYTEGHRIRHAYAEKFKNHIDLFGGACGSPRLGNSSALISDFSKPWDSKPQGIVDYMFHIVVENDFYDDYYTEKITDCFATGTIPVYAGSPSIGKHFNHDGIIQLNQAFDIKSLTPELYYSKMDAIKDNFERVKSLTCADDKLYELIHNS